MKYRHGAAIYEIEVKNPGGVEKGVANIEIDGKPIRGTEIPLADDGQIHRVLITMGEKVVKEAKPVDENSA